MYDQSQAEPAITNVDTGLWNWASFNESNLFEVNEFRAHMPLHNFYEGYGVAKDGSISNGTFDAAEERLRGVLEECDHLRFVQSLVDMDSSWGGFAHEMLTYISEECPSAVVVTFGNDWTYPLADQSTESVFALTPDNRDKAKNEARKRINVASALSLLSEVSTLLVPIAMSQSSLPASRFANLHLDHNNCAEISSVAATAIELALSAYRKRSVYEVVEGVLPGMKVMELAASFPFTSNPTELLNRITHETEVSLRTDDVLNQCSLLPATPDTVVKRRYEDEDDNSDDENEGDKVFYRRFHLHGSFASGMTSLSSLSDAIDRVRSPKCAVQWTPTAFNLPSSYLIRSLADASVDAVSQLLASRRVGSYLQHVMRDVQLADKRVLFEFTRAGMNPDALEDLDAALGTLRDAYQQ